jgi:hypothetical protein
VALGAPCFFGGDGEDDGEPSGVALGDGDRVSDGVGVSNGSGVGELFFFRCGEALGVGVGEVFFFFGLGDGDSDSVGEVFFFFGEGVTDGIADSFSRVADDFFNGLGVGVGDFCFVAGTFFFLRCLGVGVGVEKIFLIASPSDCSARSGATCENRIERTMRRRSNMETIGRGGPQFLEGDSGFIAKREQRQLWTRPRRTRG